VWPPRGPWGRRPFLDARWTVQLRLHRRQWARKGHGLGPNVLRANFRRRSQVDRFDVRPCLRSHLSGPAQDRTIPETVRVGRRHRGVPTRTVRAWAKRGIRQFETGRCRRLTGATAAGGGAGIASPGLGTAPVRNDLLHAPSLQRAPAARARPNLGIRERWCTLVMMAESKPPGAVASMAVLQPIPMKAFWREKWPNVTMRREGGAE